MPLNFPDNPIDGQTHEESQQRWVFRASPASWYVDPTYVYQPPTSPEAPVITGVPTINNTSPTVGDTLTATPAPVTGNPTPSRTWQWFRDATPVGTNSPNYTTVLADEGSVITVRQTETNSEGSDNATSLGTDAVVHVAPVAAGNLMDQTYTNNTGNQVYDTSGDFTGEALVYSLQTSTVGVTINSSTGVVTFDTNTLGLQVGTSVVVRATNSGGFADSGFSFTISDSLSAPVITGVPVINDTSPTVGQTLTASPASVTGNPTPTRTWQWQLNNVNISGATNITYTVALGDEGGQLSVIQIETNSEGSDAAESALTSAVVHVAPTAGGALQDQTFEQNTGNQTYSTAFDFTGADLVYSLQTSTAGVTINSSTGVVTFDTNTLGLQTGTSVIVRATNSGGFVDSGFSFTIAEQLTAPVITGVPTIDNTTPTVGDLLTATPASVTGNPTPARTWQWQLDDVDINGATNITYTTVLGDEGGVIKVRQIETNSQGSDNATSLGTSAVVHVAPTAGGALQDQIFVNNTGNQTYDTSFDFTGEELVYSVQTGPTGVTVNSSTGVVTFDTNTLSEQYSTAIVIRATNSGGFVDSGFSLSITVAAVLSGAQASADGATGATGLQVTTDQPADGTPSWGGTLYWGIYPTASTPSASDIKAGTGATVFNNQAISAGTIQTVADQTGLTAETAYKAHYVQENGSGLDSNVDTSLEFVTEAGGVTNDNLVMEVTTTGASEIFTIVCSDSGTFNATITCPTASPPHDTGASVTAWNDANLVLTFPNAGTHTITVSGTFSNIRMVSSAERDKLTAVTNLGATGWGSQAFISGFQNCGGLATFIAGDSDTSGVTSLFEILRNANPMSTVDVTGMDTSSVTNMNAAFRGTGATTITGMNTWDVSSVTTMASAFRASADLTGLDTSTWNTASLTNIGSMFLSGGPNVTDPSNWNVAGVTNMNDFMNNSGMTTTAYNNTLINWEAQNVQNGISVHFGSSTYNAGAPADAKQRLIDDHSWVIVDGGQV